MSAAATAERAPAMERPQRDSGPALFDDRVTLEDLVLRTWEDLVVEGRCACPVCGGSMAAAGSTAACLDCGSEFS